MAANREYLAVLAQVVDCLRTALRDEKLPELTPEQVWFWLQSADLEDVQAVWGIKSASASASRAN